MTHQIQDIEDYHAGDALEIDVTVEDSEGKRKDITGGSVEWLLKEDEMDTDDESLLQKTTDEDGVEITDPSEGDFTIIIDTDDTEDMIGTHHHRCRVTDNDGRRSTIFHGSFTVEI